MPPASRLRDRDLRDDLEDVTRALLLSGGMDSTAIAWWLRPEIAIFVNYGQRPRRAERRAAEAVATHVGMRFYAIDVDCSSLGSGSLAGTPQVDGAPSPEWWPFRNQLLVTLASAVALREGAATLMIGTIAEDHVNRDGTPEFVETLDRLLTQQEGGLKLEAPAIGLTAQELLSTSAAPPEVLGWSHSCFVSDIPCLKCRGCAKQLATLRRAGLRWPPPSTEGGS